MSANQLFFLDPLSDQNEKGTEWRMLIHHIPTSYYIMKHKQFRFYFYIKTGICGLMCFQGRVELQARRMSSQK